MSCELLNAKNRELAQLGIAEFKCSYLPKCDGLTCNLFGLINRPINSHKDANQDQLLKDIEFVTLIIESAQPATLSLPVLN